MFYIFQLPGPVLGSGIQGSIIPKRTYGPIGVLYAFIKNKRANKHIISAMSELCAGWKGIKAGRGWSILSAGTEQLNETD